MFSMTLQAPHWLQDCSAACSQAITDRTRESQRVGRGEAARDEGGRWEVGGDKRTTGGVKEWQKSTKGQESRGGGGLRWLVCLIRFALLCQLSQASIQPAETERDESAGTALQLVRGKVKWAPAGMVRSKAGGGFELLKIAWAELQAEFLMPHLLFSGSAGLSVLASHRSTYNQTSSIGTPLWVLLWNSPTYPTPVTVSFNSINIRKLLFHFAQSETGTNSEDSTLKYFISITNIS